MKPFWRTATLSQPELDLIDAVGSAHYKSSFRQNPSTVALQCAAQGSGDLCRSIAAALVTFGGKHGPIKETYELLEEALAARSIVWNYQNRKEKVPGWGSSFTRGAIDDDWKPVHDILENSFNAVAQRLNQFTNILHSDGIVIFPNPSAYTAAAALALGMPKHLAPYLLIMGRLSAWAEIFMNETKGAQ